MRFGSRQFSLRWPESSREYCRSLLRWCQITGRRCAARRLFFPTNQLTGKALACNLQIADASFRHRQMSPTLEPATLAALHGTNSAPSTEGRLGREVAHELNNIFTIIRGYADRMLIKHGENPALRPELLLIAVIPAALPRSSGVPARATFAATTTGLTGSSLPPRPGIPALHQSLPPPTPPWPSEDQLPPPSTPLFLLPPSPPPPPPPLAAGCASPRNYIFLFPSHFLAYLYCALLLPSRRRRLAINSCNLPSFVFAFSSSS